MYVLCKFQGESMYIPQIGDKVIYNQHVSGYKTNKDRVYFCEVVKVNENTCDLKWICPRSNKMVIKERVKKAKILCAMPS